MTGFLTASDGARVPVFDGMIVARVHGCDLVVDDTKVSRKHARLIVAGGVAEIEDLGSSNGTLLNGKLVARRVLRDGDELVFGSAAFRYSEGAAAGVSTPAASPPAAAIDDDVDLFGGPAEPAPPVAPKPPAAAPRPAEPPRPVEPARPAAPPRPVVEFADEVVEIKALPRPPAAREQPGAPQVQRQQKVLQFSRNKDVKGGAFADDLAQMGGGKRAAIYIVLAVAFAAVVYAIVDLMG